MNGKLVHNGNSNNLSYPTIVTLPIDKHQTEDLYVAMLVINENTTGRLEVSEYSEFKTGLYKTTYFERVLRWKAFKGQAVHVFFLGIFLVLGFFFSSLHLMQPKNVEYLPAGQLAFTLGVFHLLHLVIISRIISTEIWLNLMAGVGVVLSFILVRYALIFARAKFSISRYFFYFAFIAFFLALLSKNAPLLYAVSDLNFRVLLPFSFLLGGLVAGLQYRRVRTQSAHELYFRRNALRETAWLFFLGGCGHQLSSPSPSPRPRSDRL